MKLLSVNIGKAQPINTKSGKTGIYKQAQSAPVFVGELGLAGDAIVDTKNHGGLNQAVYVYGTPDYDWWSDELGKSLAPGTFGENLTITELVSADLCIGDRLLIGDVTLEVTSPRIPCVTLATRMQDPTFVKRFVQARRYGAYCRVIQTGDVEAGLSITRVPYKGEQVSIVEVAEAFYSRNLTNEQVQRILSVPIGEENHEYFRNKVS